MKQNNKQRRSKLKQLYFKAKGWETLIETSSSFLIILACVITLPYLAEIQLAWLGAFLIFMVAINHLVKRMEFVHPEIKIEYEKDEFKKDIYDKIESFRKEIKKLKNETKNKEKQ